VLRSWLESVLFTRANALIRMGRVRPLVPADAPDLPRAFHPAHASEAFETADTSRFGKFIWQAFWATGAAARNLLTFSGLYLVLVLASPLLLARLLRLLPMAGQGAQVELYALAVVLGLSGMVGALVLQHYYYNALAAFAIIVNGINRRVVRHALRLRHSARSMMRTGDLVNHLSSDTDAIAESAFFIPEVLGSIVRTLVGTVLLWVFLGPATLVALAVLVVLSPLAVAVANRYRKLDHQVMELRDERVTLMSQILQGIRVVKFQAWEDSVHADVARVRRREIRTRIRIVATDAVSTALFVSVTTLVAFAGFGAYVLMGGTLNAPIVFACLSLFALLEEPFGMISHLLANIQHARVATERLHKYFSAAQRKTESGEQRTENGERGTENGVGIHGLNIVVRYPGADRDAINIGTLHLKPCTATAIVGAVGSGKSTLLRALAGLHQLRDGDISYQPTANSQRPTAMAYVPQEAFILNATVRENIRFGSEEAVDASELEAIVDACALRPDLAAMTGGLNTEIGERGVNLSGGQKQRVSLARAAYAQPNVVFLDDPLSAVDVHTEDHLVEHLLFGIWRNVTRVVVTHRLVHLHRFDQVIVLEDGRVIAQGTYEQVKHAIPEQATQAPSQDQESAIRREVHEPVPHATGVDGRMESEERFMSDEDRDTGAVSGAVFGAYASALVGRHRVWGVVVGATLLATTAGITVLPILQTWWMGHWTDVAGTAGAIGPLAAVAVFGALGAVVLLGWMLERFLWLYRAADAGRVLHDDALNGVLHAPIRFFDTTPIGRVLNRFARDQEAVDDHLSWNIEQSFKSLAQTIGSLILVIAVIPVITAILVPVLWIYYRLQRDYRTSAREAKRLESIARSPRYAHFKELVTGLDVIHGFGRERFFLDGFHRILTDYQRAFYTSILLNRWFSVRVPMVSCLVGLATSIGIVFLAQHDAVTAGIAGLVLTYALSFWGNLNWAVRAFSEVESRMTSVERLHRYWQLEAEPEVSLVAGHSSLAEQSWPSEGRIEVRNLSVRYAPHLPLVLKNVSFDVPARSKVGIIGRTGSGKSTLFQTLFRFVEPAVGTIYIDGVDIRTVPLQRLRRALAIIPQDPTLFLGTIRSNLDRYARATDEQVWTALRRVQLEQHIRSLPDGLLSEVLEGGLNFSQGQRQLLCMARAILADARIIVLDEATASVDLDTDALIQRTIREEFTHATVLIIAHRLDTVAESDMVVELSGGEVVG
jgi:ABC-type multidrug transport system fused ATPase/permease subunit